MNTPYALNSINFLQDKTNENTRALDIGAGNFYTSEFLAARGIQVTAIDQRQLDIPENLDSLIQFHKISFEKLSCPYKFNLIIANNVFPLVNDICKFLYSCEKIAKPNAIICFSVLGKSDEWFTGERPTKINIEKQLNSKAYKVKYYSEEIFTGKDLTGNPKRWHIHFWIVVLQRPN